MTQSSLMHSHSGKRNRVRRLKKAIEKQGQVAAWVAGPGRQWHEAEARLLEAVTPAQRPMVATALERLPEASLGLHTWLCALAWDDAVLPQPLPSALVQVYLEHAEAVPGHECGECGLALPVVPVEDGAGEADFFVRCPHCDAEQDSSAAAGRPLRESASAALV
jgi:hypothetical protein